MFKRMIIIILMFVFSAAPHNTQAADIAEDSMKDLGVVLALGGAGAVLGLSTLSFIKVPSKSLRNILVGGAIGIILGVGVVAYSQASKSKGMYETSLIKLPSEKYLARNKRFSTSFRSQWHNVSHQKWMAKDSSKAGIYSLQIPF